MDHEILFWLKSDQEYSTGLALFDRYGHSSKMGRMLRIGGATVKNRLTLLYELGKIAKHLTVSDKTPAFVKPQIKQDISKTTEQAKQEVTSIEKLRSEQKMIYKMLDNLHAILPYREIQERKDIAFQILDLDNRLIELKQRIEHFEKNGVVLPEPVKEKLKSVSEMDTAKLIQRQMNVRTYITRYKRLVADSKSPKSLSRNRELLEKFQLELDDINNRLGK
jgi:intein/homing endonuclease